MNRSGPGMKGPARPPPSAERAKLPEAVPPRQAARRPAVPRPTSQDLESRARRAALLGHRLTSLGTVPSGGVQRRAGPPLVAGQPGDPFERQAEAVAERVAADLPARDLLASPPPDPPGLSANGGEKQGEKRKREEEEDRELRVTDPEPLRKLHLAMERLEDFSAQLENVSVQQLREMEGINPEHAARLQAEFARGRQIAAEAPGEYSELERQIEGEFEEAGRSRQAARRLNEEYGARVDAAIGTFEGPMQEVQRIFASPPPAKKWEAFKGNPARADLYHTGAVNDPIPFVWYKSPESYQPVTTRDGVGFGFPNGPPLPFLAGQLKAQTVGIGAVLMNVGSMKESRGDTVPRVRKDLTAQGVNLRGLDIDHVLDLGFGGPDSPENMWPLDADVNRRPVRGWRSNYGLNYKVAPGGQGPVELRTAAINDLVNKWFMVKEFMAPGGGAVPEEGREPMPKSGVLKKDEAAAAAGAGPAPAAAAAPMVVA